MAGGILEDTSDQLVAGKAIEDNLIAFFRQYGQAPGGQWVEDGRLIWYRGGVNVPLYNDVLKADLMVSELFAAIEEMKTNFSGGDGTAMWWVGPTTRPSDLGRFLESAGLQRLDPSPGMAMKLDRLAEPLEVPGNLRVEPVNRDEDLRRWVDVALAGNGFRADAAAAVLDVERRVPARRYLAWLDEEPVATAALHLDGRTAGVYWIAVLEPQRGKGIGAAVTVKPLQDAWAEGYRVGVLQASQMGLKMYRRLGFRKVADFEVYRFGS